MPRGIRLVAQPAEKVPFKDGGLVAQVFDEDKYKAWYAIDPCADPEPFSSKDKILSANVYLADIGDFAAMNSVWDNWVHAEAKPARATVEARLATPDYKVEIQVIALA